MNDFTKHELEMIVEGMDDFYRTSSVVKQLMTKIQSMIDNYCEHEWELTFSGSIITGIYCQKCAIKLRGS